MHKGCQASLPSLSSSPLTRRGVGLPPRPARPPQPRVQQGPLQPGISQDPAGSGGSLSSCRPPPPGRDWPIPVCVQGPPAACSPQPQGQLPEEREGFLGSKTLPPAQ